MSLQQRIKEILGCALLTQPMRTAFCVLALFLINVYPTYAQGNKANMNSLQSEILAVQFNKSTRVDITTLIKKYIPVGTPEVEAREIFKNAGFRISEINIKFEKPSVMAVWVHKKGLMSQREARIVFWVNASKITSIAGDVFYYSI